MFHACIGQSLDLLVLRPRKSERTASKSRAGRPPYVFARFWPEILDKGFALIDGHRPRILSYRSSPLASGALLSAGVRKPNRPCASSLIPAVKYSQLLGPAAWSLPKRNAHKRSFWIA